MKVTTEQLPGSQVSLRIEVEPEELEASKERAYRRLVHRVAVPGFRKGKAPRALVERYLGVHTFFHEAMEEMIPRLCRQAVEEQQLAIVGEPIIEEVQEEEPVNFTARIALQPKLELGDYRSLRLEPLPVAVEESEVDAYLEALRQETAPWEPVERAAQAGDLVTLQVQGSRDGQSLPPQEGVEYLLREGSPNPVPGFAEALVGSEKGSEHDLPFDFPPDHPVLALAGHTFRFQVRLLEVKGKALPALDDEFAKGVGVGYDSLEALRERVRGDLRSRAEAAANAELETRALNTLVERIAVEIPDIMVEHQVEHLIQDRLEPLQGSRVRVDEYLRESQRTEEDLRAELRSEAQEQVLRSLVMLKLGELEGLTVTEEEVEQETATRSQAAGAEGPQVRAVLEQPEYRESLARNLLTRRTIDRLIAIVTGAQEEGEPATPDEAQGSVPSEPEGAATPASESGTEAEGRPRRRRRSRTSSATTE